VAVRTLLLVRVSRLRLLEVVPSGRVGHSQEGDMSDWFTGSNTEQRLGRARATLLPDEQLLASATGMLFFNGKTKRPGAMLVTDRRVILYATKLGGREVQDFAYPLLTTVDHSKGITWSWIALTAAGNTAKMSVPKAEIDGLVATIRDQLAKSSRLTVDDASRQSTVADEIRQLAALRDEGLITSDEYELKKTRLLGL
jgi:hypothetical protein